MPTFDEVEKSPESGEPYEFFTFEFGSDIWRYVNSPTPILFEGNTYLPVVAASGNNRATGGIGASELKVTLPSDCEVVEPFKGNTPRLILKMTIVMAHRLDDGTFTDSITWVRGTHKTALFNGAQCTLSFETGLGSLNTEGLSDKYSTTCPHVVYGPKCNASLSPSVSESITVFDLSDDGLQVTLSASVPADKYVGGVLIMGQERATVVSHTTTVLNLLNPLQVTAPGDSGTVAIGCDHVMQTCATIFENLEHFGGASYIPLVNVYEKGLK